MCHFVPKNAKGITRCGHIEVKDQGRGGLSCRAIGDRPGGSSQNQYKTFKLLPLNGNSFDCRGPFST